nr:YicC family protein [Bacteroides sp.]
MLLSMTGFGKSVAVTPERKITVEIKSLNSKQADISTRVPSLCREIEMEMRNRAAAVLQRGKIDLMLQLEATGHASVPAIDLGAMKAYKEQIEHMAEELGIPEPADWYATLLRLPEVLKNDNSADSLDDQTRQAVFDTLDAALDELMAFRSQEGHKLEMFFAERIERISGYLAEVEDYESERVARIRERIDEGMRSLNHDVDASRVEQEMIFYIEKLDVNEEKQRLAAHMAYFLETMNAAPGQGKKLGFIAQEMGREINTLGSKSNHAEMQRLVVKMKDELEQIKEQVLNVM